MVQSSLRLWAAYTLTDIILSHLVYWHKSKFIVIIKSVHQQHHTSSPPASRCLSELFIRKNFFWKNVYYPHFISMGGTTAVDADLRSWGHKGTRYRQKEGKNQGYSTYVVATEKELCRPFVIVLLLMPPPLQTSQFVCVQCANNPICSCPEQ